MADLVFTSLGALSIIAGILAISAELFTDIADEKHIGHLRVRRSSHGTLAGIGIFLIISGIYLITA